MMLQLIHQLAVTRNKALIIKTRKYLTRFLKIVILMQVVNKKNMLMQFLIN